MSTIQIRPARSADKETILAFCSNTWDWGDYIENTLEDWLTRPDGLLLTATIDEQPVGIIHLHMLTSTDAWLEGVRVDPAYRRQGIARALYEAILLEAMRRGATYVRLVTDSQNTVSIHLAESIHMRKVAAFSNYTALPFANRRTVREPIRLATLQDLDEIIDYLNVSNLFPLTGGLYYINFTAYPITAQLLEEKIQAQQIYLLQRWERLDGLAIGEEREEQNEQRLSVGYIDGTTIESISLIAHDLRRIITEKGLARVRCYIPDLLLVHDAFQGVEYTSNNYIFYTYERGLL